MSDDEKYIDMATVRELLLDAQDRRGQLTYEQKMALQHAEWFASDARNGFRTEPEIYETLFNQFMELEKISKFPSVAAKLAEILPLTSEDVRVILASSRITVDAEEVEYILEQVRKQIF